MAQPDPSLMNALRAALAGAPAVKLAVLFGSRSSQRGVRPDSDVDIGVLPRGRSFSHEDEAALVSALSLATGLEVDLVRLDRDEPLLGREIAIHGACIHEDAPGVFAAFRADAVSRFLDFEEIVAPHRARFLKRLAGGARR